METNFHGPFRLIRAALPHMRAKGTGTIVNITSIAGLDGLPSCSLYAGSKFALEGMLDNLGFESFIDGFAGLSESLAREVAPLGIRVLLVEPGAFRTQFAAAMVFPKNTMAEIYPPVQDVIEKLMMYHGTQRGDPNKAATRIVEAVDGAGLGGQVTGKVLRLALGKDCIARWEKKIESEKADLETGRAVGESTDFD
jgi:NAD(P)-dependent dehydrogenase (short-subunit alcohol dehydrogenase family)